MKMGVKVGGEGDWEIGKWGNGVCGCEDGFGWIDVIGWFVWGFSYR